jgi:acyl-CoA synthetase (AMP-forming)/AMP-acid ligase II
MIATKLHTLLTLTRAGIVQPERPDRLWHTVSALLRYGTTPAAGYIGAARKYPGATAVIDDRGTLTFREVDERTNALARALAADGVGPGDGVAIMCRNHRGWVDAVVACSKLGAHALFLNTAFSGPQLADVLRRERPRAVVFDEEFDALVAADGVTRHPDTELDALIERFDSAPLPPPKVQGRAIILTSGTTGAPKGAARSMPKSIDPIASLLSVIPLRAREPTMIAAPLFHAWGFVQWALSISLASTVVLKRRFDPEATLALTARHGCTALVAVPVMLQRILELDDAVLERYDLSRLRVVPVSGSALPGAVSERWMDRFGENLYNLYGSTEVAWATIATPQDLRESPGTVGRPPRGSIVKIFDEHGFPVPPGQTGRIFVGNDVRFEGYTGGGGKDELEGLLSSGDVGHFDAAGRLCIDGRDDDMIISGGENVFPGEVEELLHAHPQIADVTVFGVEDERFGQRLKAVIVKRGELAADDVRAYVKANLAGYKVPRDVEFVDELPRTATGKVLKRELRG